LIGTPVNLPKVFDPQTLMEHGRAARGENRLADAQELFAQAVAECRYVEDPRLLATALKALGQVERDLQHPAAAIKCYAQAAAIYEELSDNLPLAHSVRHIADILREQKRAAEAEHAYNQALEIYRPSPEALPLDVADAVRGLALLKDGAGAQEDALLLWQEACHYYTEAGAAARISECQASIAFLMGQ
jgi:tetratricopeptide (TPR) repeat protein